MGGNVTKSEKAISIGNLKLYFNKTEFIPGEMVEGNVVMSLTQETFCDVLTLKFKATEQMIYKGTIQKPYTVIDRVAQMIQVNKKLDRGTHTFQFQYQLPTAMQPTYYIDKANEKMLSSQYQDKETVTDGGEKLKFTLMYMMTCELEINDSNVLDLSVFNIMKIGSAENNLPIDDTFSEVLSNFFGKYGFYKQKVFIKRSEFNSGEVIPLSLAFENKGNKPLKHILVKLMREQNFIDPTQGKNQKQKRMVIAEQSLSQIVGANTTKENIAMNFKIPDNPKLVLPTYQGGAFACRYFLELTFTYNGACCTEIKSVRHVPITIIAKNDRRIPQE